jgi:hypothetical protein
MGWDQTPGLRGEKLANNCMYHRKSSFMCTQFLATAHTNLPCPFKSSISKYFHTILINSFHTSQKTQRNLLTKKKQNAT